MVDNVTLNAGSGGDSIAADDISGTKHQRVKIEYGDDGSATDVSSANPLPIIAENLVSTNNSTTSTLGVSGNYTGTGEDVSSYTTATILVDSSHDSAASGMTFEFSTDNTNWDDSYAFTYTASEGARRFQFPVIGQYFRVNYTNGGTGQTHFRLQTIYHKQAVLGSVHRVGDDTSPDRSAQLVKSVLLAQAAGTGDFTPIDATAGGNLKVSIEEVVGAIDIQGDTAHDAADTGDPVKIGAVAETTEQTAVGDGDRVNLMADTSGKLVVSPFAVGARYTDGVTAAITGTGDTAVIAAPGAGLKLHITSVMVTNSHASVSTVVELKDGTTVKWRGNAKADGGGFAVTFPTPIVCTANTAFNAANVTTGSNTYVSATAYIAP